ncbi:dicarboxylate/amino acid:cation symporter [Clostridium chauvoei]|uniref:Dicarboxylate/amino acid:cation symporter n=2 Tax=Clostridium chauvoei TaxID=46867 RepID=A0ABD4RGL6_9CLOT|nr:dicarboxylate/amino acid:cation symporter [Clostridium chauvoei]ATD53826.1 sodium:proton antiporter [Clostridium chauvoei]ATD58368.1 sodium:proton antiporter [Clostridium chauvoei]MBX7280415.1 dicarboxylate/amino acid:cation symporter [Clostridium chauvoei]MBX7282900.1 dicarboxylate/amino acid:cation symporter [Clostridium chauvoei]MBX7285306.1 dicarboxylate/amino acid:cation symporter [Clostridium chauvoei]
MKKFGLIPKLILSIILGIIIGSFCPKVIVGVLATFNSIFGSFLGFMIPLIIVGFVVCGIADLGKGAGKMLGLTTLIAYASTLIAGLLAYFVSSKFFPLFIHTSGTLNNAVNPEEKLVKALFTIDIPPIMSVMTALILAFLLGLGISAIKGRSLYNMASEFQQIVELTIKNLIIPLLPIHIMGIFANMTFAGEVKNVLSVFWKVFLVIIALHFTIMFIQFLLAGIAGKKNAISLLKNQIPGYLTALGTQSSAATIPVNLQCAEKNKVSKEVREFVVPLGATIHLSGSTITLTCCAIAVMLLNNMNPNPSQMMSFIAMLGVTMVAAPGVPGGAVMAALGVLQSVLGFSEAQIALMIALYITQDSFGTACNVSGDNAIAIIVDSLKNKLGLDIKKSDADDNLESTN